MSRVGKYPISIPSGVKLNLNDNDISVSGPKGSMSYKIPEGVKASVSENALSLAVADKHSKEYRAVWGLSRALIANMVQGVSEGFTKSLRLEGVGYRAKVEGSLLQLDLGFSHPIFYEIPEGVSIKADKPTEISIHGNDKQQVGQVAANIRSIRKPEPYKGKGIRYDNEVIIRKEGKKSK